MQLSRNFNAKLKFQFVMNTFYWCSGFLLLCLSFLTFMFDLVYKLYCWSMFLMNLWPFSIKVVKVFSVISRNCKVLYQNDWTRGDLQSYRKLPKNVKQSTVSDHLLQCKFTINSDDFCILAMGTRPFQEIFNMHMTKCMHKLH